MKIEVRSASSADLEQWTQLRYELWPDCSPERHRLEVAQILGSTAVVALAFAERDLAGFAEASVRTDHLEGTASSPVPYLEGWYVREPFRGQGIGRALLSFIEDWAISKGFDELASDADLHNDHSIRLHTMLGFDEVGRSVHFVRKLKKKTAEPGATDNPDNARRVREE